MLVAIPDVLTAEQVAHGRRLLEAAQWVDGRVTAGHQGAHVKNNRQLPQDSQAGRELGEMILTALSANVLFMSSALPLHVRDEEDSLWPRLAGYSPALDATMAQMRAQHFAHQVRLDALTSALEAVRQRPNEPVLHRELAAAASTLETDFEDHLGLEEAELFPFLEEALGPEAHEAVIREIRARRSPPS